MHLLDFATFSRGRFLRPSGSPVFILHRVYRRHGQTFSCSLLLPARPHCWVTGLALVLAWQVKTPRQPLAIQICGTPSKTKQPKLWLPTHLRQSSPTWLASAAHEADRPRLAEARCRPSHPVALVKPARSHCGRALVGLVLDIAMHRLRAKVDSCFTTAAAHCGMRRSCAGRHF